MWANVTFSKGVKSLREGSLDAYDTVMIRMRWNNIVQRDSLLVCEGKTYQVLSLDGEYQRNEIEKLFLPHRLHYSSTAATPVKLN